MKPLLFLIVLLNAGFSFGQAEKEYFQQRVDHTISVTLNAQDKSLDGFTTMHYHNHSGDTLHYIWFHLWPNAYKNDRTAFSEQLLRLNRIDFYFSNEDQRGFINRLNFKVDGLIAHLEDHPLYIDVAKLILPYPLPPGRKMIITTPFYVKLPYLFSRSGYIRETFQLTQWYPKPAVYDRKGWHPMPYLDQGEFYSEWGNFDVTITVPEEFHVAATGEKQTVSTKSARLHGQDSSFHNTLLFTDPLKKNQPSTAGGKRKINKPLIGKKSSKPEPGSIKLSGIQKTYHFRQQNVHDFAWFADKHFIIKEDTLLLPSGKIIQTTSCYLPESESIWKNSLSFLKEAILSRSNWLGEYPYNSITVVETRNTFSGGMEYPTITNISQATSEKMLDLLISHEVGHNWNYGILANNEREHPWLDEGINTFYDTRYESIKYPKSSFEKKSFLNQRIPEDLADLGLRTMIASRKDQPISTSSENFSADNYYLIPYNKSSQWLQLLEDYLGKKTFDSSMKAYFEAWKFKHPYPEDFKNIVEKSSGQKPDAIFSLLEKKGNLVPLPKKTLKPQAIFSFKDTDKYQYIFFSPSAGINKYDKLMAGVLVHNYTLPEPDFHFFIAPMYGSGSRILTGMARAGYNIMSYGAVRKTEIAISAAKFSIDDFKEAEGKVHFMGFHKIVPSLKLTFRNKNAVSGLYRSLQWKSYFMEETEMLFSRDTLNHQDMISFPANRRYLNELTFSLENRRALYPYEAKIKAEQGKGFARFTFDGAYFFNYAKGGGMDVRVFAGKFLYLQNTPSLQKYKYRRYFLNMTGPNGYEDYTYSNYFIGRNEFEQLSSQQIMLRDGGFKVRTDLLSNKVGISNNWLAALNFSTDFPEAFNPLQLLPIKLPLKIFVDIGTYSEAWENQAEKEKFIYDAGFQLSFFKDLLNIYVPVLYSEVYRQYFKSTLPREKRFWQSISFSIDIQKFSLQKFIPFPGL